MFGAAIVAAARVLAAPIFPLTSWAAWRWAWLRLAGRHVARVPARRSCGVKA
jgi:hypothetical protein